MKFIFVFESKRPLSIIFVSIFQIHIRTISQEFPNSYELIFSNIFSRIFPTPKLLSSLVKFFFLEFFTCNFSECL